ncbi:MAG: hypothetical protein FH749_08335 [Firmicutes bacterium]|nr:hypothetical protein [Bacillota bacterium]
MKNILKLMLVVALASMLMVGCAEEADNGNDQVILMNVMTFDGFAGDDLVALVVGEGEDAETFEYGFEDGVFDDVAEGTELVVSYYVDEDGNAVVVEVEER